MHMLKEFCAENMELVPAAVRAGTSRIELCDNLSAGGTSPSYGVIRHAVHFAREKNVGVMAMCRPRGGDFVYRDHEREMLIDDVRCARSLGATGVVFGCLKPIAGGGLTLDMELVRRLVEEAKGRGRGMAVGCEPVQVTFHMAFDALDSAGQPQAINALTQLGVERVLTHGGSLATPIEQNLAHLRDLVSYASDRIIILPGGGITWKNAESIAATLGVCEVHGTRVVRLER
ncbi:MAG: copper homeostasis protein CutC [Coriobacteriales bacterium]|nr:copper homeostasis protein CutC [Coriobacteriales bacterium]